jgi:transposase
LPYHSPDFKPIETTFSRIKDFLRRIGVRAKQILLEAISEVLDAGTLRKYGAPLPIVVAAPGQQL